VIWPCCPVRPHKIFLCFFVANHRRNQPRPVPPRGAFHDRHERWVRDAVDVMASPRTLVRGRAAPARTAKSCGPDAPRLASS
jgi:hypothetical protein